MKRRHKDIYANGLPVSDNELTRKHASKKGKCKFWRFHECEEHEYCLYAKNRVMCHAVNDKCVFWGEHMGNDGTLNLNSEELLWD
jgi:hypothetical protein